MRSLYESIISTDREVQNAVTATYVLEQIRDILIKTYGSLTDPKSYKKWVYRKTDRGEDTYMVVFQYNLDKDDFSTKFRKLINQLKKIEEIDLNWHIVKAKKVFKDKLAPDQELYQVEVFLDDERILEFWVDDTFVNYERPAISLGLAFIVKDKYKSFVDLFEGEIIR